MRERTRWFVLVATATVVFSGCLGGVTAPDRTSIETNGSYDVADVAVWTSGSTTEYKSQVVVAGTLRSTADEPATYPEVVAEFELDSGETATVGARYDIDQRLTSYEGLDDGTLDPGEAVEVRAVFDPDPENDVTVRNATILVGTDGTGRNATVGVGDATSASAEPTVE